jgi:predicted O-methyltransferase YrrM
MKWESDLKENIKTYTSFDDEDGGVPHPLGYECKVVNDEVVYPEEVTDCNRYHLLQQFLKVRDNAKSILEIGIGRNAEQSFAYVFFNNKRKDTVYVGLDIDDRSFLRDQENNIHTIQNDSSNYQENVDIFKQYFGVEKFDFIFIDGWHSINQVLRDWEYTNLLADGGIVGFHDTSCHPGPHRFVNALDTTKWNVIQNCCPNDWGIGFAWKK